MNTLIECRKYATILNGKCCQALELNALTFFYSIFERLAFFLEIPALASLSLKKNTPACYSSSWALPVTFTYLALRKIKCLYSILLSLFSYSVRLLSCSLAVLPLLPHP